MVEPMTQRPHISRLSRRELLAITAAAAGGVLVLGPTAGAETLVERPRPVRLPDEPSHNPGFLARASAGGGLVVWTQKPGAELVGYRLNARGRAVWELCDGTRDRAELASRYAATTGRPAAESLSFLARLLELGIVAQSATVVPLGDLIRPPAGGCYHLKLRG
ncbi:MAG TPA: PqqD family protein [Thermoanaerobaculaceae bacterium]|nr:PqqD family protein [Thermoanaerobaculaceae bacterium]HPS76898.1 PqqD family protein [Thermoanaerobaculaceae bacterium]